MLRSWQQATIYLGMVALSLAGCARPAETTSTTAPRAEQPEAKPKAITVGITSTVQAISLAGGFSEDGSSGRIRVVRQVEGKTTQLKIKLDEPVLPGDTIVVKAKLF